VKQIFKFFSKLNKDSKIESFIFLPIIFNIIILLFCLKFCFSGLDFTDETTYLSLIVNRNYYDATVTQFGYVYYFLYWLTGFNIGLFRIINIILLLGIYSFLSRQILRFLIPKDFFSFYSPTCFNLLGFSLTTLPLAFLGTWLPTPNYNLLNLEALGLVLNGLLLLGRRKEQALNPNKICWSAWLLIGLGGYLVFLAKPTTAAGLALVVLVWLFFACNLNVKGVLAAVSLSFILLLMTALLIDGSVSAFILRYERYIALEELSGGHSLFAWLSQPIELLKDLSDIFSPGLLLSCLLSLLAFSWLPRHNRKSQGLGIVAFFILLAIVFVYRPLWFLTSDSEKMGHLLWVVPFGAVLISWTKIRQKALGQEKRRLACLFLFAVQMLLYHLGSNNTLTHSISLTSFFLFYGFIFVLSAEIDPVRWLKKMASYACFGQVTVACVLVFAWSPPYRQIGSLWNYNVEVKIPENGSTLKMAPEMAEFIQKWRVLADNHGFDPATPVIDLTGRSPGAIFILGAYLPKTPWLYSGYSGADQFAVASLKRLSCRQLTEAWLIIDLDYIGDLKPDILVQAGLDFDNVYYQLLGQVDYPIRRTDGGIIFRPLGLLAPLKEETQRAETCSKKRENNQSADIPAVLLEN
jgi:hypothetical protein